MKTTLLASILIVTTAGSLVAQTPVRVAEVRSERLQQRQAVTGSLRAVARGEVSALEAGRLISLSVREGESVEAGDVIARIDARRLEAQRAAAQADLRVAEAELKRHQAISRRSAADLKRSERLVRQNAISVQELDQHRATADVALAQIESTERQRERSIQSIRLLDVRLSDTQIRAPYHGTVVRRHVEPGQWVQPGDALLTLVSTGPIEAWLEVPERLSESLTSASPVAIESAATGVSLDVLSVKRIADVNRRVRTIQFVATVDNPEGRFTPGMSVKGWVPSGPESNHLTVPKDALTRRSGQAAVFVIDDESRSKMVAVRVLFETDRSVAVEGAGLASGMSVITEGNERLMPQQWVQVIRDRSPEREQTAEREGGVEREQMRERVPIAKNAKTLPQGKPLAGT